ncbi:MAG TPA: hypothetical protein VF824_09215 [Thermoanaerobaculia bacterium]
MHRGGGLVTRAESRRELALSAAFAVWGLAIAIALAAVWLRPAPPEQIPGLAKALGFDAHAPFRFVAGLMLLPLLLPLALRPLATRLAQARLWPRAAVFAAVVVTLWFVTITRDVTWAIVPCALVVAAATLLRARDLRFTRRDAVLLPVFLTALLAMLDVAPNLPGDRALIVAALLVFAVRAAVAFLPSPLLPAFAFIAAPFGLLLQTSFFARDQRYFGWHALAFVTITPFVLRLLLRDARRAILILTFLTYPVALYSYANAMSLPTAEGKPRVNFFEDSHPLMPASEYLRGELPYRDVLPAHGLLEDGLFDYGIFRIAGVTAGTRLKWRFVIGNFNIVALYAIGLAATGSAEAGLFAALLAVMTGAYTMHVRLLPSLVTLALLVRAVRTRRTRLLLWGGLGTVICGLMSVDFGAYAFVTLLVILLRWRRWIAWRAAMIGVAIGVVPMVLGFALFGILDDFVRTTFVEVLSVGPAYTLKLFEAPPPFANRPFPDVLAAILERDAVNYFAWCAIVVWVGATLVRRPRRRTEGLFVLAVWSVAVALSYAERHHLYFSVITSVFILFLLLLLVRRRSPLALPAIAATIVLAGPTTHLGVLGWMRRARAPVEPNFVELREPPRARGAYYHASDAQVVEAVGKYLRLSMNPEDTFFDLTNRGMLYFLYRRDCPIREYEVAFYEREEQQRAIIARLDANPHVRAVLVPGPHGRYTVDNIPNPDRAPLVWQWVQQNFEPDFEEGEVVFWRRK